MINIFLVIHLVVALLLVAVIMIQKTGSDGLSGLSGGAGNSGLVNARSAATFMNKMTIILAVAFMINSIILANLSTRSQKDITDTTNIDTPTNQLPMKK